jgi:hypothetical protein
MNRDEHRIVVPDVGCLIPERLLGAHRVIEGRLTRPLLEPLVRGSVSSSATVMFCRLETRGGFTSPQSHGELGANDIVP